jgi:hypothetical protein
METASRTLRASVGHTTVDPTRRAQRFPVAHGWRRPSCVVATAMFSPFRGYESHGSLYWLNVLIRSTGFRPTGHSSSLLLSVTLHAAGFLPHPVSHHGTIAGLSCTSHAVGKDIRDPQGDGITAKSRRPIRVRFDEIPRRIRCQAVRRTPESDSQWIGGPLTCGVEASTNRRQWRRPTGHDGSSGWFRVIRALQEDPPHLADDLRTVQAQVAGGDQLLRGGPRDVSAFVAQHTVCPMPGQ